MKFAINDIIRFKNGNYLILDIINTNGNKYLYLINNDDYLNDVAITKVIENGGVVEYTPVDDNDEFNYVLNKLFLNIKDDIFKFVENEVSTEE